MKHVTLTLDGYDYEATFDEKDGYEYPAVLITAKSYSEARDWATQYAESMGTTVYEVINVF